MPATANAEAWNRSQVRKRLKSPRLIQALRKGALIYRTATAWGRLLPDFLIIGAHRCGTTSLFSYLAAHPSVFPACTKEVHYFDNSFWKGLHWYRARFPSVFYRYYVERIRRRDFVTGEASPYYLLHPLAAQRAAATVPHAQLIAVLRNPIDRAYSHYQQKMRKGIEPLSFEEAIEREPERLRGEREKILQNDRYRSRNYAEYSYLTIGLYMNWLEEWMRFFPKQQLLVLNSEGFYTNPTRVLSLVVEFLGLEDPPGWHPKEFARYHYYTYPKMRADTRKRLSEYYAPHNQRLYEFVGTDFGWER
ncbi:MAG: sulfotransferase domain-containing protein [Armatimonadetes bacterium]|nr:sulfotransferase domain-containing protein [Armatimonadota bacterium]